jgi:hypothetical protein
MEEGEQWFVPAAFVQVVVVEVGDSTTRVIGAREGGLKRVTSHHCRLPTGKYPSCNYGILAVMMV